MRYASVLAVAALSLAGAGLAAPSFSKPAARPSKTARAPAAAGGVKLGLPLACEIGVSCEVQQYVDHDAGPSAVDYHCGRRSSDKHAGTDFRLLDMAQQRRGVRVLAAAAGKVVKARADLPDRGAGSATSAEPCGNEVVIDHGGGWRTRYCHLARASISVKAGQRLKGGDPIGGAGLSGDTAYPGLEFEVLHGDEVVDPFAPAAACSAAASPAKGLWTAQAAGALAYKPGAILNAGFAGVTLKADDIEAGDVAPVDVSAPLMAVYLRAIGLEKGDVVQLSLTGPDGKTLAQNQLPPLDSDRAQFFTLIGRKRPKGGWPLGRYSGALRVLRDGQPVLQKDIEVTLQA